MIKIENHIIDQKESVIVAMTRLNSLADKLTLFVINEKNQVVGTLTDGDIRRGLIAGYSIQQKVEDFMFRNFRFIRQFEINVSEIRKFRQMLMKLLPVLNREGELVKIIDLTQTQTYLPVAAVLMAGGRGERLRPLTDHIPKPLLPVGTKPIIEHNIDHLIRFGIEHIFISVNYLADQIESYFGDGRSKGLSIEYIHENKPLGTIGAVTKVVDFHSDLVLVMNSDLFTNIDFEELYQVFQDEDADMVVATIPYNIDIPYAIMELKEEEIVSFKEKPTYTYHANAGIYLFKKEMFKYIPEGEKFDVTDLMQILLENKCKVAKFPIIGYWLDIGKMEDYQKAIEYQKYIR
jgi:dTDP-glucose pyrophosphorylase